MFNSMKKMLFLLGLLALTITSRADAGILADVIFVVDESGSMGTVQANIRNNIGTFASILSSGGIDGQYGLVGYGSSTIRPRRITDLTTPGAFATAAQGLLVSGATEPAFEGIMAALNGGPTNTLGFSFRSGAVKNIIIVTDEVSNGDLFGANFTAADALLKSNNALLNGILNSTAAGGTTPPYLNGSLGRLVTTNGGTVFSLTTFNTNNQTTINNFVQDFANRKLQEIQNQATVPEPSSVVGFGFMLVVALGSVYRRRARQIAA